MRDFRKYPYPYHGRHLGIPRDKKGFLDWNSEGMGGNAVLHSKHMGGCSSEFPEGEDGESFA